jgi:glycosyltransferase involved in cell wall biosynthesis
MTRDLTVAALLLRLPSRPPLVYESHGYAPEVAAALPTLVSTATAPVASKLARLSRRESFVWRRADGYVTITSGLACAQNARFGARPRVAVVPDGTRIASSGTRHPHTGRVDGPGPAGPVAPCTVGYAGHLYAWKGVDVLLEAIAQVGNARCVVAGGHAEEPDLARLQALAARLGIESRVTFTGLIAPSEVPGVLGRADILALPNPASAISTHATSPLKLFEYMAAGKAIIASNLPAIREVLTHDVNALLVTPGDAGALAAAIRRLAGDPALREALGAAARAAVAEYSWDRRAERLEALFTEVRASIR